VGLIGSMMGYPILDPLAGLLVAGLIVRQVSGSCPSFALVVQTVSCLVNTYVSVFPASGWNYGSGRAAGPQ
jgi:hypothetical protein